MIDFKLWLEAKRKKKIKKIKPVAKASYDIDAWFKEVDLLAKDLKELQQAQIKAKMQPKKKVSTKK